MDMQAIQERIDARAEVLEREAKEVYGKVEEYREEMTRLVDDASKTEILQELKNINSWMSGIETRLAALEPVE